MTIKLSLVVKLMNEALEQQNWSLIENLCKLLEDYKTS